jgi:hypothetical protein
MRFPEPRRAGLSSFLSVLLILAMPVCVCAQEPTSTPKPALREDARLASPPTFETLLAADTYKMYGEVRNLGQLLSTGGAGEIVDPIVKLADPPQEFKSIVKFLKANAEPLASSRALFAAWPARTNVPNILVAIEFGTPEEASKFAPKLESFLPTILPPVPVQPDDQQSQPPKGAAAPKSVKPKENERPGGYDPSAPPQTEQLPFVISHEGTLVFISDKAFKQTQINPPHSKLLAEDQNFRVAHDRFASEPIFVFFNIALEDRTKARPSSTPTVSADVDAAAKAKQEKAETGNEFEVAEMQAQPSPTPAEMTATLTAQVQDTPESQPSPTQAQQSQAMAASHVGSMLNFLSMGDEPNPDAVGLALVLDNNEYVIRAMLLDPPNVKYSPIPFLPQLVSSTPTATNVTSVLPGDTEAFVSASIDFTRTYQGMRKQAEAQVISRDAMGRRPPRSSAELLVNPFAEFEKKAGFKISEDLLPAFGNEIAIAGSLTSLQGMGGLNLGIAMPAAIPPDSAKSDSKKQASAFPILAISIKDRDGASRLLPHVLNGLGVGEANLLAQKERHGDAEMVNYAGMFAYAFVGDFLVISDAASVRHIVDAYNDHQTLSSNSNYRNSSRWQPRESLGQIYISPALMEAYQQEIHKQAATLDQTMRDFLLKLSPEASAITYALSNDGLGTLHELHLPKNLIISMVAGMSSATKNPPPEMNEGIAIGVLQMIAGAEIAYKSGAGKGAYGTLDQLIEQHLASREMMDKHGYKFDMTVYGSQFEVVATPLEYGKTGKRSFFIDQSNVLRAGDHGGGAATIADNPIQ